MLKKNYGRIAFVCLTIALLILCISQYQAKELYKSALTSKLIADISELRSVISSNDIVYGEILRSGKVSKSQANYLMGNNDEIRRIIGDYSALAVHLGKMKEGFQYVDTPQNALKLTLYFKNLQDAGKEVSLDPDSKVIIEKAQDLNSKWSGTISSGQITSIADDSWIKLLVEFEKDTHIFLGENKIENIEEFWLNRREVK
jgi:hypothetical protein